MREIQDLTLNRLHSTERLEKEFAALRSKFENDFMVWESGSSEKCVSIRASLLPQTNEIWNRRVYSPECWPILEGYLFRIQGGNDLKTSSPSHRGTDGRRILNGYRTLVTDAGPKHKVETHYDGSVYAVLNITYPVRAYLCQDWFLTHVANALLTAHLLRTRAGVPEAQYAFGLEIIWSEDSPLTIGAVGPIEPNPIVTRYTFGSLDEIDDVLSEVYDDLMSAVGSRKLEPAKLEVEIRPSVLERFEEAAD